MLLSGCDNYLKKDTEKQYQQAALNDVLAFRDALRGKQKEKGVDWYPT
jgi:hypothetical protein